jgi:signal transduction histidine kinase
MSRLSSCGEVRRWFISLGMALAFLFAPAPARGQEQRQVLALYGGSRDTYIALLADRELPRLLAQGQQERLDYYSEFIDRSRSSSAAYLDAFEEYLRLKYRGHRFEVVIAMDHIALGFVEQNRAGLFAETPIVFFSSRPVPQRPANATGVIALLNFRDTLTLATTLQPEVRQVFVVNGTDKTYEERAREQFQAFESRLSFIYLSGLPARDLEARLAALPAGSIVYYLFMARDGAGDNFNALDYLERVASTANAPTYSWAGSAMGRGIVGGSLRDLDAQLAALSSLAVRVIRGAPAESLPVQELDLNVPQVDARQLRRWRISDAHVPAGTLVKFREASVWDRYRGYIISALALFLVQSISIAALLLQRARRRRAEAQVLDGQAQLQASYARIRDLSRRLLEAQESERGRIARELHDDISQQMALLQIDLELLGRAVPREADGLAVETLHRARDISKSVHDLSHRLHPAKLRLIGLVAALQGLEREMSQPGVSITFAHENVPASLPLDLTISLFRVAQEALQNALKHGGARHVALVLSGGPERLALTITDDGAGFEVKTAWGRGIGLISMGERVDAIGGTLNVQSAPGQGTRLDIRVPLPAPDTGSRAESA